MNRLLRILYWLVAFVPVVAAGYWASFATALPQRWQDREALGDVSLARDWSGVATFVDEPFHVAARALHLALFEVPGATFGSTVWINVLFALLLVAGLTRICRRAFRLGDEVAPWVFLFFGLLVATPAFGANWLHHERAALLLVPVLFVEALVLLQGERRFAGRALVALLLAAAAPLCHTHGLVVFVALVPALLGAAARNGSARGAAWLGALLVVGTVAGVLTMRSCAQFGAADADWLGSLTSAPMDTLTALLREIGGAWLDLLPTTELDEAALGLATVLLPLGVWLCGERDEARRAPVWWSCYLFGLLVVVVNAGRYELAPPVGSLREATFGAFLLPVGALGVLAARVSMSWLTVGAGAMAVLCAQDWYLGLEDLRLARMRVQAVEAALRLPQFAGPQADNLPVLDDAEWQQLREREWVAEVAAAGDPAEAFSSAPKFVLGSFDGGAPRALRGTVRSSLRLGTAQWIAIVARQDGEARVVGDVRPQFAGVGRDVPWSVTLTEPLPEGAEVRAVGFVLPSAEFAAIGPVYVVKNGALVVDSGS